MPFFKTTKNILVTPWEDEAFSNLNLMNSEKLIFPNNTKWDYSRELQIEDVMLWEQIYYLSGGLGFYASYEPYAEFYMITYNSGKGSYNNPNLGIETFYGIGSEVKAYKRAKELGMIVAINQVWVEPEDMWLHT